MSTTDHPAAWLEPEVLNADGRAKMAMIALAITVGQRVFSAGVSFWQASLLSNPRPDDPQYMSVLEVSDHLAQVAVAGQLALFIVTGVLFLRWLRKVVELTHALGGDSLRWTPKDATWSFIIPFVSFVRPYHVLRDVHDHLAPDALPEPPVTVSADATMGYRAVKLEAPPPSRQLPHAAIGAWWGAFWIGNFIANAVSRADLSSVGGTPSVSSFISSHIGGGIADAVEVISAALALAVVRGVTARLDERFRRARYNSPEVLQQAGMEILPLGFMRAVAGVKSP